MGQITVRFDFTGEWVRWKVPQGVTRVDTVLDGGQGGGGSRGGRVTGSIRVKDTDDLWIAVGRAGAPHNGKNGGSQVWPNGGAGGDGAGGGGGNRQGGDGGGGASLIRLNRKDGDLMALAAGGGGHSGDGGAGGAGGGERGQNGARPDATGNTATGGSQSNPGQGGKTSAGSGTNFYGADAENAKIGRAGAGGTAGNNKTVGGGGGGGGYYSGGGGQAGLDGGQSAGGGGGGSNYNDGLMANGDRTSQRSAAAAGHGSITLTYQEFGDYPPSTPTDCKAHTFGARDSGTDLADDMVTRAKSITISGVPDDPTKNQDVRLLVLVSRTYEFQGQYATDGAAPLVFYGTWDEQKKRDFVDINGLAANTRYYVQVYAQDKRGQRSNSYASGSFWTNRPPDQPVNTSPESDSEILSVTDLVWTYSDPDDPDVQSAYQIRFRSLDQAGFGGGGSWNYQVPVFSASTTAPLNPLLFNANTLYAWSVRTADTSGGLWSEWSEETTFRVVADAIPPVLISPQADEAVYSDEAVTFSWLFLTKINGEAQERADFRYRVHSLDGTVSAWTVIAGDTTTPGADRTWVMPAGTFEPRVRYEWGMRTYGASSAEPSEWTNTNEVDLSEVGIGPTFWTALRANVVPVPPVATARTRQALGVGHNRAYLYLRGGEVLVGEITPLVDIQWNRARDDISSCTVHIDSFDAPTKAMLATMRTWAYEIVVFRDGVRAWEGPIVRITNKESGSLEIEAKDVMGYVYRRILRQGYNDSYQIVGGTQIGLNTVVTRATRITVNALAYDDPNVLDHLTPFHNAGDATQSRIIKAFTKTAWEEIDDLAATAGLDYTTVGRRIMYWDTHRPIGRLPEMRNGDFSDTPIITEYGMALANVFGVTTGSDIYGVATRPVEPSVGYIEQLANTYGDNTDAIVNSQDLSETEKMALIASLNEQAERNIANRYPTPQVVRIPDNAQIMPTVNLGINELVPGVWVPLRAQGSIRSMSQWQKLDSMIVREESSGEKITCIMSPAPNSGEDPDSTITEEA